jgi:hypothetical protein
MKMPIRRVPRITAVTNPAFMPAEVVTGVLVEGRTTNDPIIHPEVAIAPAVPLGPEPH